MVLAAGNKETSLSRRHMTLSNHIAQFVSHDQRIYFSVYQPRACFSPYKITINVIE